MSDEIECLDITTLAPQGRNFYPDAEELEARSELIIIMRERIKEFIKDAPGLPGSRLKSLEDFIKMAPEDVIHEIYSRMMSVAEAAETLSWKTKLKEYIEGNPPPPKYETDRGGRLPLQFLEDVWGEYMDHGVLYQDTLSSYDDKLIPAIYNYWNRHERLEKDRLPLPKQDRTDAILQRVVAHGPDALEDVIKAVRAHERRGQRSR